MMESHSTSVRTNGVSQAAGGFLTLRIEDSPTVRPSYFLAPATNCNEFFFPSAATLRKSGTEDNGQTAVRVLRRLRSEGMRRWRRTLTAPASSSVGHAVWASLKASMGNGQGRRTDGRGRGVQRWVIRWSLGCVNPVS